MTDNAVDALYTLPLDEFIAARNDAVKRARLDGDAVTATRLKGLTKPTVAAWAVNQVVRLYLGDVEKLLGLGAEMRAATAARDGAKLAELNRTRRTELVAFVAKATKTGTVAGRTVSADTARKLGETLEAAIIDPQAGEAVLSGRLATALQHVGFGVVDEDGAPADVISLSEARTSRRPALRVVGADETADDDAAADEVEREADPAAAAERDLSDAEDEVEAATADLDRLEGARDEALAAARVAADAVSTLTAGLERVAAQVAELEAERDRLTDEVERARDDADRTKKASRTLDDDLAAAERRAEAARKRRREARAALRS